MYTIQSPAISHTYIGIVYMDIVYHIAGQRETQREGEMERGIHTHIYIYNKYNNNYYCITIITLIILHYSLLSIFVNII